MRTKSRFGRLPPTVVPGPSEGCRCGQRGWREEGRVELRLVSRRHVDLCRVASQLCR
ncbi:MAG: putative leader peptide [Actinomycetes bacterium]